MFLYLTVLQAELCTFFFCLYKIPAEKEFESYSGLVSAVIHT